VAPFTRPLDLLTDLEELVGVLFVDGLERRDTSFVQANAVLRWYIPVGPTNRLILRGEGGTDIDAGSDGPVVPVDCDLTKSPKDSPSCVDESAGIFFIRLKDFEHRKESVTDFIGWAFGNISGQDSAHALTAGVRMSW